LKEQSLIRFEGFELDPAARVVKRDGRPIQLNPKTFDLLLYLAEHPHQLVTKDQLLKAVWPDSFVEESNLSQHVFLLRKTLASNGGGDQIVVTIPGKGYQFSAAIERVSRDTPQQRNDLVLHAVQSVTRVVVEEEADDAAPAQAAQPALRKHRSPWFWMAAAAPIVIGAAGLYLSWRGLHPVTASPVDAVLAEVENSTGDSDFDHAVRQALQIDLEQTPFVTLLSNARVRETLAEMQQPPDARLTLAITREVCERNNAQVMLTGSISRLGSSYLVLLGAESCVNGKQVAGAKAEAGSKEQVLAALDSASAKLRRQMGESPASLERFGMPVAEASTPSLEALRVYSQAGERLSQGDEKSAQALLERAVALDPNFANAYALLAAAYYNRGDFAQAAAFYKKAFDLREHTTERERLNLEFWYYSSALNDYEQGIRSLRTFLAIYPQSPSAWGNLCNMYTQLGEYSQAIDAGEHALRLDPHGRAAAEQLARAYKRANRFAEAKQAARTAIANGRDSFGIHSILFQIAYAEGDAAAMKLEGEWGLTHQHVNQSLEDLGSAAATSGRLREALDDFDRARTESLRGGDVDYADEVQLDAIGVLVDFGATARAAERLNQLHGDAGDPVGSAILRAEAGDDGPAQRFLAKSDPVAEKSTVRTNCDLPELRAELALSAHKPQEAIQILEPARPYQLRDFEVPYLRARAEAQAGQLDAAAQDYRLILSNPGVDPISDEYPLSHLFLARVLALEKKTDSAREEYRAFFTAWQDADPDLKILSDARGEFARLK
jgi:eukaryotic-like serine/threonine-protein kinase